ncbi:MAG TPA: acetate--CoA ligase family protein, partial [Ramlibacter sp.]|nr:acetate--CoA ligase family protein [Ramlibacter sp.]
LPPHWSHGNPIDLLGDATPDRYAKALEVAIKDPHCDGMLVLTAPQGLTEPTQIAELLKPYAHGTGKPVLACFMGGAEMAAGNEILNRAGVPTFQFPDTATRAFTYMWKYSYNLRGLYETPVMRREPQQEPDRAVAERVIAEARAAGRSILTEAESKQLLSAYHIPTVETRIAECEDEAVAAAEAIGFPVVLKLHSRTITHKTDVGGVRLNIQNVESVRGAFQAIRKSVAAKAGEGHFHGVSVQPMIRREDAYELIVGSSIDPQFGPVLLFGEGGQLVEVSKDRALSLPPLNSTLALRMIEQTRIYRALRGVRGRPPVDLEKLQALLVNFSQLVVEQPRIKELDINPVLASAESLLALDARVVLHDPAMREADLPRPAIRPYPIQYVGEW